MSWNLKLERQAIRMRKANARAELDRLKDQAEAELTAIQEKLRRHPQQRKAALSEFWQRLLNLKRDAKARLPKGRKKTTGGFLD